MLAVCLSFPQHSEHNRVPKRRTQKHPVLTRLPPRRMKPADRSIPCRYSVTCLQDRQQVHSEQGCPKRLKATTAAPQGPPPRHPRSDCIGVLLTPNIGNGLWPNKLVFKEPLRLSQLCIWLQNTKKERGFFVAVK